MKRSRRASAALAGAAIALCASVATAAPYNETLAPWNINVAQSAQHPLQYEAERPTSNNGYTASPENWRQLPCYSFMLDKWADGDPRNNDHFETIFEWDWRETQLRHGGDIIGLGKRIDYFVSLGIKCIYIIGTPFLNMPWQSDGYSALDFTLLDPHYGTVQEWRDTIDALHDAGIYIILDFTVGTMGDLIGFEGHLNVSTPFSLEEYNAVWKRPNYAPWDITEYPDFKFDNGHNSSCQLPTLWLDSGEIVDVQHDGCKASEFDQYGDMEAFGVHPDWQRQLAKFASVQDRLREWQPDVNDKLQVFSCLTIQALDIDGIRIDKATQVTVDALARWSHATRECAKRFNKDNFYIPGEVTGGDTFSALYIGRGRTPMQLPPDFYNATELKPSDSQYFLRDEGVAALDGVAFHYSVYRSLARWLGMDGNLQVAYDVDPNFVAAFNQMTRSNDFLNPLNGKFDPRHMYGTSNHDVFRWPSIVNGTQRQLAGTFINTLLLPGIPLYYWGEEQGMYLYDSGAPNYLYGRQPMTSSQAWQRHGCYKLGSAQYFNMPLDKALTGCEDDWNSLDHYDPTAPGFRLWKQMNWLRDAYPVLTDGFNLIQWGNWTYFEQLPGSNQTQTQLGLWSAVRAPLDTQNLGGDHGDVQVFMLYTNENVTRHYEFNCTSERWISTPYEQGTKVTNLFYPFEEITLETSLTDWGSSKQGCLPEIDMDVYGFKAFVPTDAWQAPRPALTRFRPGHDARILSTDANATSFEVTFEFDTEMSCESVTRGLTIDVTSFGHTGNPTHSEPNCETFTDPEPRTLVGERPSAWRWTATIQDAPDGIYVFTLNNVSAETAGAQTHAVDHLLLRKGRENDTLVFPEADYNNDMLTKEDGIFYITHVSPGASIFRYTVDYGRHWSAWAGYEAKTKIPDSAWDKKNTADRFWSGEHVIVQYYSDALAAGTSVVHADHGHGSGERRVPQFIARGPFNNWGYDKGINAQLKQKNTAGRWQFEMMSSWPTYIQLNVFDYDDYFYGDGNGDGVMERNPPNSLAPNYFNLSAPPHPHLGWAFIIDDKTGRYTIEPRGNSAVAAAIYALLLIIPPLTALAAVITFRYAFYGIKQNVWGFKAAGGGGGGAMSYFPIFDPFRKDKKDKEKAAGFGLAEGTMAISEKPAAPVKPLKPGQQIIGWPENVNKRRKCLIATLEYEILDWKLKVKIGGLGVMSTLMGKAMHDCDLVWVVPKVKDLEYPDGDPCEPIEVTIFGEPYLIEVQEHKLDNITYVILDSPVFRAQTKSDPYPQRMDDLSSAIFYSTWNQAIAETIRRYPVIDIYHINDYHGALAPLYLLPKVIPVCLSLHNAEFQGLWPLRTKEEMKEVCAAFNVSKEICTKYVQFGNTFNLLHAAASFISIHQKSVGVAGVSDKYGKRSWARYPALWTLRTIDSLPNPDPSDIEALDEQPVAVDKIKIDEAAEAKRPEDKRQAQEWAGIKQDPNADLFVFVGRWSKQKGVDLIADVMPSLLEKKPSIQLITVGPVIDLYGRFAAEKLARLMEMYPDRVFSKPEFTALPPFLFSGADFALIPSRDEPFGLVAVEFGRKGALGVGSRLGGLGLMPGWWFPVESDSTQHMLSQLTKTIKVALKSSEEERAILRARSAVQRFPVVEWRQRLEDFHRRSITTSRAIAGDNTFTYDNLEAPHALFGGRDYADSEPGTPASAFMSAAGTPMDEIPAFNLNNSDALPLSPNATGYHHGPVPTGGDHLSPGGRGGRDRYSHESYDEDSNSPRPSNDYHNSPPSPGAPAGRQPTGDYLTAGARRPRFHIGRSADDDAESFMSRTSTEYGPDTPGTGAITPRSGSHGGEDYGNFLSRANRAIAQQAGHVRDPFMEHRTSVDDLTHPTRPFAEHSRSSSFDSISSIMEERTASPLNAALHDFTDADGEVARSFVSRLQNLSPGNSKGDLCIEKFLMKSEKAFFQEIKKEKMAAPSIRSSRRDSYRRDSLYAPPSPSMMDGFRPGLPDRESSFFAAPFSVADTATSPPRGYGEEPSFAGDSDHSVMSSTQRFMQRTIGGWPLYCIIIALGQMLSATSFQLTLLSGTNTQEDVALYIIGAIFLVASAVWWLAFRYRPSVWVLATPWLFYGVAFLLIGFPSLHSVFLGPRKWISDVATWSYAIASAAGFLFFGLNFGEEAGAETRVWIMRACIVQGSQQIWVAALWYWGYTLNGTDPKGLEPSPWVLIVVWPLGILSFIFAFLMFKGLPDYYWQLPPFVPNFWATLFRRKLVIWFLISEVLRNYWLSAPYGRNWTFLWNNDKIPTWAIVILIAVFFIGVWAAILYVLMYFSRVHSWLLPVFAVGLGAPRWCQMLWGTSSIGLYVPWGGEAGPYLSTSLWLWLGVLDAIQGVGLGMILLQTLSRLHVCATLALAQITGSVVVMVARATAPNRLGPGSVFPDASLWDLDKGLSDSPIAYWAFWVALICQLIIVVGYLVFFRKEQLSKP